MSEIILDETIAKKLREADYPVELRDASGKLLGKFVPHFDPSEWEIVGGEPTEEELERLSRSTEKRYSAAEVMARLRRLEKE